MAALVLPACSQSRPTVTIGTLYPSSGPLGAAGVDERHGVELAAEWANAHLAKGAPAIKLDEVSADRVEAVPGAMDALARKGVQIVVGSHSSDLSAVAAQVATQKGMLFWETGAVGQTDGAVTGGVNFIRMAPMGANLGADAIDFIRDEMVPKLDATKPLRYAVAYVDDVYGSAVGAGAAHEIQGSHLDLVGTFPYPQSTTDFAPLAQRIAASHPDVLFVSAYLDDAVALRKATVAAKLPLLASIGTSSSYCHPAFGAELGTDATGLFASDKPDAANVRPDALTPEGRAALEWVAPLYQRRFHVAMSAPALSGFSNATALFAHVIPAAPSASAKAVAETAITTKLPLGTLANGGGMDIAAPGTPVSGNNMRAASVIWEWLPSGPGTVQRTVVWPPTFAEHAAEVLPLA
jgi:ABC-type branched-subunit amino acid transport system substrate-binding protein